VIAASFKVDIAVSARVFGLGLEAPSLAAGLAVVVGLTVELTEWAGAGC